MNTATNLLLGDCAEQMRTLASNSVDAIVTDPPYALVGTSGTGGFMGAKWDSELPTVEMWKEALRVAKPGAHLLAFGGTRTYHRLACAIEDAGWEIRDCIMWVYGSGFPKSMDIAKAIDKASGYKGEVIGSRIVDVGMQGGNMHAGRSSSLQEVSVRAASVVALPWQGWGTALKPAVEPIVVARKPLEGTVAANVLKYGTGAINIDGCRVPTFSEGPGSTPKSSVSGRRNSMAGAMDRIEYDNTKGRFPANLIHDGSDEVLALFPDSKGQCGAVKGTEPSEITNGIYGKYNARLTAEPRGDTGSAARFFKCCRDGEPSAERRYTDNGGTNFAMKPGMRRPAEDTPARFFYCAKVSRKERDGSDHPTMKPLALMRYLVRLVTRKGGIVLDPFMGSGTTGVAAVEEGMCFIGIERDPHYYDIATHRLAAAKPPAPTITQPTFI